jgi:hypothetical protein
LYYIACNMNMELKLKPSLFFVIVTNLSYFVGFFVIIMKASFSGYWPRENSD